MCNVVVYYWLIENITTRDKYGMQHLKEFFSSVEQSYFEKCLCFLSVQWKSMVTKKVGYWHCVPQKKTKVSHLGVSDRMMLKSSSSASSTMELRVVGDKQL